MTKTYFNDAIIGNSRMLGCLTGRGELVRLFWPHIDYPQHIDRMLAGVFDTENRNSTLWLSEGGFRHRQYYVKDTNILKTVCTGIDGRLRATQTDYGLAGRDILIRQYEIENTGDYEMDLGFIVYSSFISTTPELRSTLFDFKYDALIHYRHNYYISISADREAYQFQLGNNAFDSAVYTELRGYDSIGMMRDGAVSWLLGRVGPGEKKRLTLYICASATMKGVKELVRYVRNTDMELEYMDTERYWLEYLKRARQLNTGKVLLDDLYKRSLLLFRLMADEESGGLLAAAEIDEDFTRCGRYAYCWGRDAAFITGALDKCGLSEVVDKFYAWAVKAQAEEGFWHQRYHMDGNLAPSWGLQIDETGTLIWGMLEHYKVTGSRDFLVRMWDSVEKGVDFLVGFTDIETGLPIPTYDLWEERVGEHTYSSAAVCAGIRSGVEIAGILGKCSETITRWEITWINMRDAISKNLWSESRGCFLRSIRTKLNPWGGEHTPHTMIIQVNPKGYCRDVTMEDGTIDASLAGVSIPFNVFDINDHRVIRTIENIERALTSPVSGGLKRYENDNYIGGNPWILTTLWIALYHVRRKNFERARYYLDWAANSGTDLGLLPEQADRETGKPAWVIGLTWSHAMFILVLTELLDAGAI